VSCTPSQEKVGLPSRRDFLYGAGVSALVLLTGIPVVEAESIPPMKVGFILPQKGEHAQEAKSLLWGFEAFVAEKAATHLKILTRDPGPEGEKTLEVLAEFLSDPEVRFIVGPPSLDASEKCIHALAGKTPILFVTNPSARLVAGEMCLPGSFRVRPNTYQSAHPLAPWSLQNLGRKTFITGDDDVEGNEEGDFFAQSFERAGGAFTDRIMVQSDTGKMKSIIEAVAKSQANFVFASFKGKSAKAFLKIYHEASPALKQPIIGSENLTAFPGTLTALGKTVQGVRTLTALPDPQQFIKQVKKTTGNEAADAARAAEGYDIAHIIFDAASLTSQEREDQAALIKFIEGIRIDGPRGKVSFDPNHEPVLDMMVQEWTPAGKTFSHKIVAQLGTCTSLDFGCGHVGFPKRPEREPVEEEQTGKE
jgi:ABC-type branched-subunit amino acid transport system substrate-binding protein